MLRNIERRLVNALNVPFLFRALIYLFLTIYALVIVPLDIDLPVFPDPVWFGVHFVTLILLALLSHANYPNHLSRNDIQARILLSIIPPLLFLVAVRQRWEDIFVLIRRDKYGSLFLAGSIMAMGFTLLFYIFILLLLVSEMGFSYLIFQIGFTWIMYFPVFLIDFLMWRKHTVTDIKEIDDDWEQVSITGEPVPAAKPFLYPILRKKRYRFWILIAVSIFYGQVLNRITNPQPIIV